MSSIIIAGLCSQVWQKTNSANATNSGFASKIPTVDVPSGDGVIQPLHPGGEGGTVSESIRLIPIGVGSSTQTFAMKIIGWQRTGLGGIPLYIPVPIARYLVTLGAVVGVANADLVVADKFGTTVTCPYGPTLMANNSPVSAKNWFQFSPTTGEICMVSIETLGFNFLEVLFDIAGGGGVAVTSANALWCKF